MNPPKNTRSMTTLRIGQHLQMLDSSDSLQDITRYILSGKPLHYMSPKQLEVVYTSCQIVFIRGIQSLLTREYLWNLGNTDIRLLNRHVPDTYWLKIYQIISSMDTFDLSCFSDKHIDHTLQVLYEKNYIINAYKKFLLSEARVTVPLPEILTGDMHLLFYLGTVSQHRFYKMCCLFNMYWGKEPFEPLVRIIVEEVWFFSLIVNGYIKVDENAFCEQDPQHEYGPLTYLREDYRTFQGIRYEQSVFGKAICLIVKSLGSNITT